MAAFQFPDPLVQQTVVNPITGSTYQWQDPPGKWVVSVKLRQVDDIIWEGDDPPSDTGYKLWYSTDTLELYFYYTDENGTGAWVPTSAPITMLESLQADVSLAMNKASKAQAASNANLTTIGLLDSAIEDIENSLGNVTLQEVLDNGNTADKGATFGGKVIIEPGTTGNEAVTYQQMLDNSGGDYLPLTGGDLGGNLTVNGTGASGTAPLIVRKDGYYTSFVVDRDGNVSAGASEGAYFAASKDNHVITKGVVDRDIVTPARYSWKRQNKSSSPSSGHFTIKNGQFLQVSSTTYNGHRLRYDSGLSTEATQFPGTGNFSGLHALTGQVNFWKRTPGHKKDWTLMGLGGAYKYRLNYGGFVEIEFLNFKGNWEHLTYEDEFFINVNGLF